MQILPKFDPRVAADLRRHWATIRLGLICAALTGLMAAVLPKRIELAPRAIQEADQLRDKGNLTNLYWVSGAVVVLFAIRYWFTRGASFYLNVAANRLTADLRSRLMSKLLSMPVSYFSERRTGSVQSALTNDVVIYQTAVNVLRDSIEGPIKALGSFIIILVIQPQLSLAAFAIIPLLVIVVQRNAKKMKAAQARVQSDLADLSGTTQEMLQGHRVIKAFGAERNVISKYDAEVNATLASQERAAKVVSSLKPLVELLGAVALAGLFIVAGYLALRGQLNVPKFAGLAFGMDGINSGFKAIGSVSNTLAMVQAATTRIYDEILEYQEPAPLAAGTKTLPAFKGELVFEHVSFTYPDGTVALRDVSFRVPPGTSLALVGKSGSGKSTIADLVFRFYDPSAGRITLDGVDILELDPEWVRGQMAIVPQHTFLFSGDVIENIKLGAPAASEETVRRALEQAHASEFVDEFDGRDVPLLGERGVRLSGGQMQRLAIARALVRDPKLLVLDEATSALDAKSEQHVTEALYESMEGRTTLLIAHRLTTAARADRILVLRAGSVVEEGSHRDLLEKNGVYAEMVRIFNEGFVSENEVF
jgi:subfamily B ATP-binding cassette protein MsbA